MEQERTMGYPEGWKMEDQRDKTLGITEIARIRLQKNDRRRGVIFLRLSPNVHPHPDVNYEYSQGITSSRSRDRRCGLPRDGRVHGRTAQAPAIDPVRSGAAGTKYTWAEAHS